MAARCRLRSLGRELSRPRKKPILTEHASDTICSYMNSFTTWGTELIALSCMHGARSTTVYHSTMAQDRSLDRRLSSLKRRPRGGGLSRSKLCSDTGPSNRHGRPPLFTSRVVEHGDLPFVNSASRSVSRRPMINFSCMEQASKERQEFYSTSLYLYGPGGTSTTCSVWSDGQGAIKLAGGSSSAAELHLAC